MGAALYVRTRRPSARQRYGERLARSLTGRQREVLQWIAQGEPDKAIALRLGISERSVRFHVRAGSARLGAQTRAEAIARALHYELIDPRYPP